jgi:hypothetical protein
LKRWQKKCATRVARWFVFKPKIPIWVIFGGFCNGKSWHILEQFGVFYGHWKYFMAIWYLLWSFVVIWYFFPRFGILYLEKSGNPVSATTQTAHFGILLRRKERKKKHFLKAF